MDRDQAPNVCAWTPRSWLSRVQTVVIDHDFSKPPSRVFAYLAEHENLEAVLGAKIKRLTDGADGTRNGVGSSRQMRIGFMPPFIETNTEVIPDELIRYRITNGSPLRDHEGVMRFSPNGNGAHLHWEITFKGVLPGVDWFVASTLRRGIPKGLAPVDSAIS